MRNIARFASSDIKGVTINTYQVACGNRHNASQGLVGKCESVQGDFQKLDEKFEKEVRGDETRRDGESHETSRATRVAVAPSLYSPTRT